MDAEKIKTERWELLWATQRSQRYHSRRTSFFGRWNKLTAFTGVIGGSAVFASVGNQMPWLATIGAAAVVVISGADLVIGTSEMSRMHNDLRRRFCELEAAIVSTVTTTESDIAKWKAQRIAIESDEPPTHVALNLLCDNELSRSYGHLSGHQEHAVPWYKKLTAHFLIWEDA